MPKFVAKHDTITITYEPIPPDLYLPATRNHSGRFDVLEVVPFAGAMKRDKFVHKEAERAGVTIEHLLSFYEVLPCGCGKAKCKGWELRWKFGARRRREGGE